MERLKRISARRLIRPPTNSIPRRKGCWERLHLDPVMTGLLLLLMAMGLMVLYSASGQRLDVVHAQMIRLGIGMLVVLVLARISPASYLRMAPLAYLVGVVMLMAVELFGDVGMGAKRWLVVPGVIRFQPSELMKLAVPMMVAAYLARCRLPPTIRDVLVAALIIALPVFLITRQPDLGTALLVSTAAVIVVILAGLSFRFMGAILVTLMAMLPVLWMKLHDYQRQRVLTFLDPDTDPLGSGWNIMQSTTAIGSGGVSGKGWLQGTQSQLEFLPERHTDFIVAVLGEEFGLMGLSLLLLLYFLIVTRGLWLAAGAQDTFGRLVSGSIVLTFFVYVFVNVGMVTGILPVVGVPLPLISYGGTSSVTLLAGFGILMSFYSNRRLLSR